jgi:hypothetical protein
MSKYLQTSLAAMTHLAEGLCIIIQFFILHFYVLTQQQREPITESAQENVKKYAYV